MTEAFGGIRVVRSFRREAHERHDYAVGHHTVIRKTLLARWLQHRLDPAVNRLHAFLSKECGIAADEPTISFDGRWYPNALAFATGAIPLPDRVRLRAAKGYQHGDFHGFNLLIGSPPVAEADYYLIDLAEFDADDCSNRALRL